MESFQVLLIIYIYILNIWYLDLTVSEYIFKVPLPTLPVLPWMNDDDEQVFSRVTSLRTLWMSLFHPNATEWQSKIWALAEGVSIFVSDRCLHMPGERQCNYVRAELSVLAPAALWKWLHIKKGNSVISSSYWMFPRIISNFDSFSQQASSPPKKSIPAGHDVLSLKSSLKCRAPVPPESQVALLYP